MKTIHSKVLLCTTLLFVTSFAVTAQQPQLVVQTGHSGTAFSLAFSPDGKLIASGSEDKTIKLWDTATGNQLRSLEGHTNVVYSVSFSPDGKLIASGSEDKTIKLWDVATGNQLRSLEGHSDLVSSVAFSPDGKVIVSGSRDGTIKLWDVATGSQLRSSPAGFVRSVAFSPDWQVIAGGNDDGTIEVWDAVTGNRLRSVNGSAYGGVNSVAFSPDGKVIAGGCFDKTIRLLDTATGNQLLSLEGHTDMVNSVAFSPNGKLIASGSSDKTIKIWDTATGSQLRSLENHSGLWSLAFSPDGKVIAGGVADNTITLWDAATGNPLRSLEGHAQGLSALAYSPDRKVIASVSEQKTIRLWNTDTGKQVSLEGHSGLVASVAFSPDGKQIASGSFDKTIKLWDVATGNQLRSMATGFVRVVAFSPNGKLIAGAVNDRAIELWDAATGNRVLSLAADALSIDFSPDGQLIAGCSDGTTKWWDVSTGKEVRSVSNRAPLTVTFSPDRKVIASFSFDKAIKLWDAATGNQLRSIAVDSDLIYLIAFSPDGKIVASVGSGDSTIKLWDAATGTQLRSLAGHIGSVEGVAFTKDGKLISGSEDGTMKLWRTDSDQPLATLISLDKDDWVVVTSDGHFDGSANGMKLIHYVQNNQAIPLDSFFEQFYTPKLLARVLSGESASVSRPTVDFSKAIKVPPLVRITSPKAGASFNVDAIQISVEATDQGGGVEDVRLYQNGKLVSDDARQLTRETTAKTKTFDVTLLSGVNTFRATAFNKDRTESNPAEIKIELRAAEASSDLYILAIGLNEYKNTRYNLNYGRADAQAFADSVEKHGHGIFRRINKQVILDDQATRKGIEEAFNKIVAQAKPQDAFVFYFAGHGVMSEGSQNTPAEFFLVPYDVVRLYGDDGALATNGVAARLLRDLCTKVRAQKQLIVLDACQSAGALETFAMRGAAEEKAVLQLARSAGVVVLAATGQDQVASEFAKLGHGVFTYALLQALSGDADGGNPPDGKITATEIVAYINDRVPELTKQYRGKTQYPNGYARGQDFPIAIK